MQPCNSSCSRHWPPGLETAGLVEGWYAQKLVGGQNVKERRYRITRAGERAVEATRSFYVARLAAARPVRKGSHA